MRNQLPAPKRRNQQGISLLEIILAVAIAGIAITALVVIGNTAVKSVDVARNRTIADQYVREGLEQVRSYRDNQGWTSLTTGLAVGGGKYYSLTSAGVPTAQASPGYAAATDPCSFASTTPSTTTFKVGSTNFYRVITQVLNSTSQDTITVTVCYNYRGGSWSSDKAQTILTNWR